MTDGADSLITFRWLQQVGQHIHRLHAQRLQQRHGICQIRCREFDRDRAMENRPRLKLRSAERRRWGRHTAHPSGRSSVVRTLTARDHALDAHRFQLLTDVVGVLEDQTQPAEKIVDQDVRPGRTAALNRPITQISVLALTNRLRLKNVARAKAAMVIALAISPLRVVCRSCRNWRGRANRFRRTMTARQPRRQPVNNPRDHAEHDDQEYPERRYAFQRSRVVRSDLVKSLIEIQVQNSGLQTCLAGGPPSDPVPVVCISCKRHRGMAAAGRSIIRRSQHRLEQCLAVCTDRIDGAAAAFRSLISGQRRRVEEEPVDRSHCPARAG